MNPEPEALNSETQKPEALRPLEHVRLSDSSVGILEIRKKSSVMGGGLQDPKMPMDPGRNPTRCAKKLENTIPFHPSPRFRV